MKNEVKITDKNYDPLSYLVKGTLNEIFDLDLQIRRTYTVEDEQGKEDQITCHSFSEFKEIINKK